MGRRQLRLLFSAASVEKPKFNKLSQLQTRGIWTFSYALGYKSNRLWCEQADELLRVGNAQPEDGQ